MAVTWGERLRRVPLFARLPSSLLARTAERCSVRVLQEGDCLFHQGDPGHHVFVVLSGKLSVDFHSQPGEEVTLATRGPGEVIGEMAILEDQPRLATVTALKETRVLALSRHDLAQLIQESPDLALALLRGLSARVRELSEGVLMTRTESLRARVLALLQSRKDDSGVARFEGPQRLVAQELGCTREALSRNLSSLADSGKIVRLSPSAWRIVE